jgi:hypothetical protein
MSIVMDMRRQKRCVVQNQTILGQWPRVEIAGYSLNYTTTTVPCEDVIEAGLFLYEKCGEYLGNFLPFAHSMENKTRRL